MDTFNDIWNEVLEICKNQVSETIFKMWLEPLTVIKFENDTVIFRISTEFKKSIILDKYSGVIKDAFYSVMGFPVEIDIIVDRNTGEGSQTVNIIEAQEPESKEIPETSMAYPFPQYTFDNFVVAKSNSFAFNVAMGVAEHPGITYNPFMIYGNSGLGKTHLICAIYNRIKEKNPDAVIIYDTCENILNELLEFIANKNMNMFHNKYRNADALLVDDIQTIMKSPSLQEEFFHTFDALKKANKQIVMTSDIAPRYMEVLDERLRTRFESGVLADVQPPNIDTRKAIIKRKCNQIGITLSESVIEFIANRIKSNVRQLEGTVNRIEAMTKIYGNIPSIEEIQFIINDITNDDQPVTKRVDNIIENVAKSFGVTVDDIRSDKRQANIAQARQATMYIINEICKLTFEQIGKSFNKSHSTVIHSINVCKEKMEEDAHYKGIILNLLRDCRTDY